MDVGDDLRRHAGEPSPEKDELRLLGALDEHRVGPERTELLRHPERQERVEGGAVECARTNGPNELEAGIGPVPTARGSEHPYVELGLERVELLGERGRERKRVPHPPDHQKLVLHRTAARSSSASMRAKTDSSVNAATEPGAASARRRRKSPSSK